MDKKTRIANAELPAAMPAMASFVSTTRRRVCPGWRERRTTRFYTLLHERVGKYFFSFCTVTSYAENRTKSSDERSPTNFKKSLREISSRGEAFVYGKRKSSSIWKKRRFAQQYAGAVARVPLSKDEEDERTVPPRDNLIPHADVGDAHEKIVARVLPRGNRNPTPRL